MKKNELMKYYEKETGKASINYIIDGVHDGGAEIKDSEYVEWLEKNLQKIMEENKC